MIAWMKRNSVRIFVAITAFLVYSMLLFLRGIEKEGKEEFQKMHGVPFHRSHDQSEAGKRFLYTRKL